MSPRFAPALIASLALIAVAGCAAAGGPTSAATMAPSVVAVVPITSPAHTPDATLVPVPAPVSTPRIGGVDGSKVGPELSVETVDGDTIQATIDDKDAKAWRVSIAGTGTRASDRLDIVVETGDVGPVITATEIRDGEVVDTMDLSGFADGTAAAGGCHRTLNVCIDSDGFKLPDGDGRFSVRLDLPAGPVPLLVRGGTAAWDGEPFILGDWHDTEAFPWGAG
jgi:hypothetical protein